MPASRPLLARASLPIAAVAAAALFAGCTEPTQPERRDLPLDAAPTTPEARLAGRLHLVWVDRMPPGRQSTRYMLLDDQGRGTELLVDSSLVNSLGGPLALDRRWVEVVGKMPRTLGTRSTPRMEVRALQVEREASGPDRQAEIDPMLHQSTGSLPYVVVLCKFSDRPAFEPHPRSVYETRMGVTYGGLDHYW